MMTDAQRSAVIAEARTWLGTKYHHMGRVKGAGCDCLTLLAEVYAAVGVVQPVAIEFYPRDWHFHRGEERYLNGLLELAAQVPDPLPGDVAMFRFGRATSHSAIVISWPIVIHAHYARGVEITDATDTELAGRLTGFYSPGAK